MEKCRITIFALAVLFFSCVYADAQSSAAPESYSNYEDRRHSYMLFPLTVGDSWNYDILKDGKKIGAMRIDALKEYAAEIKPWGTVNVVVLLVQDEYLQRSYEKHCIQREQYLYIFNPAAKTAAPFLKTDLAVGDKISGMIVTSTADVEFLGKKLPSATLKDLNGSAVETYLYQTGLYYWFRNGVEYKLVSCMVQVYTSELR